MKIYKYTPHIDLFLETSSLKITPSFQLNDPYEAILTQEYLENMDIYYKTLKDKKTNTEGYLYEVFKIFKKDFEKNGQYKGITCFTLNTNDFLMWSHYAKEHNGGILEFTVDEIMDTFNNKCSLLEIENPKKPYHFGRVKYDNKRSTDFTTDSHLNETIKCAFQKSKHWKKENEIRILLDYRYADYYIIPKDDLIKKYIKNNNQNSSSYVFYHDYCFDPLTKKFSLIYELKEIYTDNPQKMKKESDTDKLIEQYFDKIGKIENIDDFNYKIIPYKDTNSIDFQIDWEKMIEDEIFFHPMLNIKNECLTGVYFGVRYTGNGAEQIKNSSKFSNLKGNIFKAEMDKNIFKIHYKKITL